MIDSTEHRFEQWLQVATRYFVLSNAGGAVAVLGFIGTSLSRGEFPKIAIISLFFFIAGQVVAGIVILGQLTAAYRALLTEATGPIGADTSIRRGLVTRFGDWVEPRTGRFLAASFGLFVVGTVIGLVALIAW